MSLCYPFLRTCWQKIRENPFILGVFPALRQVLSQMYFTIYFFKEAKLCALKNVPIAVANWKKEN